MNEFIHTLSLECRLNDKEKNIILKKIDAREDKNRFYSNKFGNEGIRFILREASINEISFYPESKEYRFRLEVIINPSEVLQCGYSIGKVLKKKELKKSLNKVKEKLGKILGEVFADDEMTRWTLCRIDFTRDITMPSEKLIQEYLRVLKCYPLKYGWKEYIPETEEQRRDLGWIPEISYLIYNKNQKKKISFYSKRSQLAQRGLYAPFDGHLLRCEVSQQYARNFEENPFKKILTEYKYRASYISCVARLFDYGAIMEKKKAIVIVRDNYGSRKTTAMESVMDLAEECFHTGTQLDIEYFGKKKKFKKMMKDFQAIGLSPFTLEYEMTIPSLSDMIGGKVPC